MEEFLSVTKNQFGFRKNHSTDSCIFLLKELIRYYTNHGSPMFITFMDASKAFDRINHKLLFDKLSKRNVPVYIFRVISMWYECQQICVKWCDNISSFFPSY